MIHINVNLINKTTAVFSFSLIDIQFASNDFFMFASLICALSALNTCALSTASCLFTFVLVLYNLQQLVLDSLFSFMKIN